MKSNLRWRGRGSSYLILALLVLASTLAAVYVSWTAFGSQIGQYAYDFLFRLEQPQPWQPSSIVLAIGPA